MTKSDLSTKEVVDTTRRLRVGLFGYYSEMNLGDNVMAHLLATHLIDRGHDVVIFSTNPGPLARLDARIAGTVDEFLEGLDLIIFGGGGLLIPRPKLSISGVAFHNELGAVLDGAKARSIRMFGVSLGGAGKPFSEIVPQQRRQLLVSLEAFSLRNPEDSHLFDELNKPGKVLGDLVWTVASKFPMPPKAATGKTRVGINLYVGRSRRYKILRWLLTLAVKMRPDVEFQFIDINPDRDGQFRALKPYGPLKPEASKILTDTEESCQEAASLDLLISTRLHLGVMAMSYGVPVIVYAGQEKTRLLYRRMGRERWFWHSGQVLRMFFFLVLPGLKRRIARISAKDVLDDVKSSADKNFPLIDSWISQEAGPRQSTDLK